MADARRSGGDYEQLLFQYQSQVAELQREIKRLQLEVEELKKENRKLKGKIVDSGKKVKTKKSGLEKFGASFE